MVEIRKAELKDFADIKNLMLSALKEAPTAFSVSYDEYSINSDFWWMSYINPFLYNSQQEMFLLIENEKPIGMVGVVYDAKERKKHIASIVWLYIDRLGRGKGHGKNLMDKALESIKSKTGIEKISLLVVETQEQAVKIYKKMGFEINGTLKKELKIDERFLDVLVMEKIV